MVRVRALLEMLLKSVKVKTKKHAAAVVRSTSASLSKLLTPDGFGLLFCFSQIEKSPNDGPNVYIHYADAIDTTVPLRTFAP